MKDCKQCGGSGVAYITPIDNDGKCLAPKLCPCVTEKVSKLERVAEAARGIDWLENAHDASIYIVTTKRADRLLRALAVLEET